MHSTKNGRDSCGCSWVGSGDGSGRRLAELVREAMGGGSQDGLSPAVLMLHTYHHACALFDLPTKAERLAALRALPDSIRPLVETEYRRIFALRAEK